MAIAAYDNRPGTSDSRLAVGILDPSNLAARLYLELKTGHESVLPSLVEERNVLEMDRMPH